MSYISQKLIFLVLVCFAVISCDNSSEGTASISLVSLSSPESAAYKPAEPFTVEFVIEASGDEDKDGILAEHVGIQFYVVDEHHGFYHEVEVEDDHIAGVHHIEKLISGETTITAELTVPAGLDETGIYHIKAVVDISDAVNGDDRSDNYSIEEQPGTYGLMYIDSDITHHDFKTIYAEIGEGFLLLPAETVDDSDGYTHSVTDGEVDPDYEDHDDEESDLIGYLDAIHIGDASDINSATTVTGIATVNGVEYDIFFWNEDSDAVDDGQYSKTMSITFPTSNEEHYFPWDIGIHGTDLYDALLTAYDETADENSFKITLLIDHDSDLVDQDTTNNSTTIDVPYAFYNSSETDEEIEAQLGEVSAVDLEVSSIDEPFANKLHYGGSYIKMYEEYGHTYGDKSKIAIGMDIGTKSLLFKHSQWGIGASSNSWAELPLYIFDNSITLLGASANASVNITKANGSWGTEVVFLGLTVLDEGESAGSYEVGWDRTWEERQTLFSSTFTIVIIPIKVEAGINGSVGLGIGLELDSAVLTLTGNMFEASMGAYAEGSVSVVVASGGVGLDFTIIEETFAIEAGLDLSQAVLNREITASIEMYNDVSLISGEFYLFVEYPTYSFCCSVHTSRATKTLYDTGALFDKKTTLLNVDATKSW